MTDLFVKVLCSQAFSDAVWMIPLCRVILAWASTMKWRKSKFPSPIDVFILIYLFFVLLARRFGSHDTPNFLVFNEFTRSDHLLPNFVISEMNYHRGGSACRSVYSCYGLD